MNLTHLQQTRRQHLLGCLGLMVLITRIIGYWSVPPAEACQSQPEKAAFDWALVEDANPLPNGMMWVGYGDSAEGTIKHVTLHRILRVLPGIQPDLPIEEALRFTVLITDGTLDPITFQKIDLGRDYGTQVEVTAGLYGSELVVTGPTDDVREGVVVEPVTQKTTPGKAREK
jgi:hypothetical protein